jgi:hypothetical protein
VHDLFKLMLISKCSTHDSGMILKNIHTYVYRESLKGKYVFIYRKVNVTIVLTVAGIEWEGNK